MNTVRKLYEKEKCYKKGDLGFLNSNGNKSFKTAIFLTNVIKKFGLTFEEADVKEMLDENFKTGFINTKEEELFKGLLSKKLIRLKDYLELNGFNFKGGPSSKTVNINGQLIKAKYDLIMEKDDTIYVGRVKNSKPDLKLRGNTDETAPYKSIELYAFYLIGKELFPGKEVKGAIFYLTNDTDSSSNCDDLSQFEFKKGKNIIAHSFKDYEVLEVFKRLDKILNNKSCGNCKDCHYNNICNFVKNPKKEAKKKEITVSNKKVSLTDSQELLTMFTSGVARVSAIAGSGKSTTLARRFVKLVENGVNPSAILGLTFTVQGVIELKEKIEYWSKVRAVDCTDINICTFNEFCYNLIKDNYKTLGYSDVPKILGKLDKAKIISNLLDKHKIIGKLNYSNPLMNFYNAKGSIFRCIELIEAIDLGEYLGVEEVSEITGLNEDDSNVLLDIFFDYKEILKKGNYISLENQIELGSKLLKPAMVETFGYEHIIVDEAQDTNIPQLNIILKLKKSSYFKSLAICGDDSQAIYGWRGAESRILVDLKKYIPELFDIKLEDNFRSTKEICSLANNLNNLNTFKINKRMIAHKNGKKPSLVFGDTVEIAKEIENLIRAGENPKDIAFIARNKKELENVQTELNKLNIQSDIIVSELLIDNPYFKNIADLANLFINNELTLNLANYLSMVKGDELSKAKDLEKYIEDEKELLSDKLSDLSNEEKFNYYMELINELKDESNAVKTFISLVEGKGFSDIIPLVDYINDLRNFEADIVTEKDTSNEDVVTLITAHSSKGKEYKNVIVGLDSFKSKSKSTDIDEERRTLFVAITRAQENLKLFYKKDLYWSGEITRCL